MIPIGMRMYPGNESEKPILRNIISDLKNQNNINGRTIQIADKGLNCARNILEALDKNDGYIFSKSVKQLSEKEQTWVLLDNDYQEIYDEEGLLKYRYKSCIDNFEYSYMDNNGREIKKTVREKRLCTYNPKASEEEAFRNRQDDQQSKKTEDVQSKKIRIWRMWQVRQFHFKRR